jgi:hypothetical protein
LVEVLDEVTMTPDLKVICLHHFIRSASRRLTLCEEQIISLLGLLFRSLSLMLCSDQKLMSLVHSTGEVLVVGQEPLEVNDVFVKESTSDNWSEFIAEYSLDGLVNVISNKGSSCITLKLIKLANVNLW